MVSNRVMPPGLETVSYTHLLVESALDSARATQNADIDEICAPAEGFAAQTDGLSEPEALYSQLQRQVLTAERACLAADRRIASVSDEMCIRDSYWADSSPFPPSSISRP